MNPLPYNLDEYRQNWKKFNALCRSQADLPIFNPDTLKSIASSNSTSQSNFPLKYHIIRQVGQVFQKVIVEFDQLVKFSRQISSNSISQSRFTEIIEFDISIKFSRKLPSNSRKSQSSFLENYPRIRQLNHVFLKIIIKFKKSNKVFKKILI